MDLLKNKTILIGKEPGQGRLEIVVTGGTNPLIGFIGQHGSVPNTVSRCKAHENTAHAKIEIDSQGNMTLVNIKSQNLTFVNGGEIESKRITPDSKISLGSGQYPIDLTTILNSARNLVRLSGKSSVSDSSTNRQSDKPKKVYNIKHLEEVWNRYHDGCKDIDKEKQNKGMMARLPMLFTMIGGTLTAVSFGSDWAESIRAICIAFTVIAAVLMIYSLISAKNDTSIEDRDKITEDFQDHYRCPNPDCRKFLGNYSYKLMKDHYGMKCPYCKSEFVEK